MLVDFNNIHIKYNENFFTKFNKKYNKCNY